MLALLWVWMLFRTPAVYGEEAPSAEEPPITRETSSRVTTGPIITDTTIPQPLGTATLVVPTFLSLTRGNFSPGWRRVSAGGDFRTLATPAQLYYGLAPRTEIYVVVPYLHNWAGNLNYPGPNGQKYADFGGLGDIDFTGKYLLLEERAKFPAVAGVFSTTFPTGRHRSLNPGNLGTDQLGWGAYGFTPGLNFFKNAAPFLLYGNLWYSMFTDATIAGVRAHYRDLVTVNLAAEYPLPGPWVLLCEFVSLYDAGRVIGPRSNLPPKAIISILPALEFIANDDFYLAAGVLIDLWGKNTPYSYTPNFSIYYNF
jgi:hypothetical protein